MISVGTTKKSTKFKKEKNNSSKTSSTPSEKNNSASSPSKMLTPLYSSSTLSISTDPSVAPSKESTPFKMTPKLMKLFPWPLCQNKKNTKPPKAISNSKV
jgi:hypothetical protein